MSIWVQEGQRVYVQKVEDKGNYSLVNLSTSRKNNQGEGYIYSSFGFTRFVGEAHELAKTLEKGDVLSLNKAVFQREPYEKDGERLYPKSAQLVVFSAEIYKKSSSSKAEEKESDVDDEFPFGDE